MIEIRGLNKQFGNFPALKDVSVNFEKGRVTGIVGPNGSGKSTLIKCLLGLVTPTEGVLLIDGNLPDLAGRYRSRIGYMPQAARYPQDLTCRDILTLLRRLRSDPPGQMEQLIQRFELTEYLDKRVRSLSGGTRQKLSAIIACMYDPDLFIFDEPTAGLDPASCICLKDYIATLKPQGRTILLTTHIMSDLEELADDIVLLLDGKVRYGGSVRDLKLLTGSLHLETAVAHLMTRGAA